MIAAIEKQVMNGYNYGQEKELVSALVLVARIRGQLREVCTARFYMGRSSSASVVYCTLWVHGDDVSTSGKGRAGGWGYHKMSAALGSAITDAGIALYGSPYGGEANREQEDTTQRAHIGGCGTGSMEAALVAIATAAGADTSEALFVRN